MNLKEFRESTDRNLIWRLQSGEVANLLDEAIEIIEVYEGKQQKDSVQITFIDEIIKRENNTWYSYDEMSEILLKIKKHLGGVHL